MKLMRNLKALLARTHLTFKLVKLHRFQNKLRIPLAWYSLTSFLKGDSLQKCRLRNNYNIIFLRVSLFTKIMIIKNLQIRKACRSRSHGLILTQSSKMIQRADPKKLNKVRMTSKESQNHAVFSQMKHLTANGSMKLLNLLIIKPLLTRMNNKKRMSQIQILKTLLMLRRDQF